MTKFYDFDTLLSHAVRNLGTLKQVDRFDRFSTFVLSRERNFIALFLQGTNFAGNFLEKDIKIASIMADHKMDFGLMV